MGIDVAGINQINLKRLQLRKVQVIFMNPTTSLAAEIEMSFYQTLLLYSNFCCSVTAREWQKLCCETLDYHVVIASGLARFGRCDTKAHRPCQ